MSGTGGGVRVAAVMCAVGIVDLGSVKFSYGFLEMSVSYTHLTLPTKRIV